MLNTQAVERITEAFPFTVDKRRLYDPEGGPTDIFGLFRSDNGQQVGNAVSAGYEPHTTDDILALTEAVSHRFDGRIEVKCHFRDGHYVSIQPTQEERLSLFGGRDNVFSRYLLKGRYNGVADTVVGMFRDLCKNLAELSQVEGTTTSIRHTSGLRPKMDDLIRTFQELEGSWATMEGLIRNMAERKVRIADFLNEIYPQPEADASQRSVTIHSNRTELIVNRLMQEHSRLGLGSIRANSDVSAWLAFNAVQGYVQHEKSRNGDPTRFDRMLMANNDPVVKRAETLALTMAS